MVVVVVVVLLMGVFLRSLEVFAFTGDFLITTVLVAVHERDRSMCWCACSRHCTVWCQ